MINLSRIIITIGVLLMSYPVLATSLQSSIVINEIAWMGNRNSFSDEWIELYNTKNTSIDLSGWTLKSFDEKIKIELMGQIKPNSYFLLERTNDDTVPNIKADQIYTGALDNSGSHLILSYNDMVMDEVNYLNGWLAGNNKTKQTMGRTENDWYNSQNPEGTPKSINDREIENVEIKKAEEKIEEKTQKDKLKDIPLKFKQQSSISFFHLAVASLLSFPSGIAIVLLKRKLKD